MDTYLVTDGILDLGRAEPPRVFRTNYAWLKQHYLNKGWPISDIRPDVLGYAVAYELLPHGGFADFLGHYAAVLYWQDRDERVDVANDNDYLQGAGRRFGHLRSQAITDKELPRLSWHPFWRVPQAVALPLDGMLARFATAQHH